jgi:hypothetical protein
MDTELNQGTPQAEPGAEPAGQPTAEPKEPEAKTPEQLEAENQAAAEAQKKQEEEDAAEEAKVKKKPWFQKRFDELTRQREEANRRADRIERMLEATLQRAQNAAQQPQQQAQATPQQLPPTRPAPTREQYDFDEDKYLDAVVEWKLEQRNARAEYETRQREQQSAQNNFQQGLESKRQAMIKTGTEKFPDFDAVIATANPEHFNLDLLVAVTETGTPAEIAYHLAKNPAEAERISKMPPLRKAIELGKIEASISASAAAAKQTKAPPPPNPVGGRNQVTTKESELPYNEWIKLRRAGKIDGRS